MPKINPHCPVVGCKTTAPHTDDPVVSGLMRVFASPASIAHWSMVSMLDLRNSIIADIEADRHYAWQTRIRLVEEVYFKALYCIFFATPAELPHIFSGVRPNGIMTIYHKVNKEILKGRGRWEVPQPGQKSGMFTPLAIMHGSAHASFAAMLTAISYANVHGVKAKLDGFITHLNIYCDRLDYMDKMFAAGRDKQTVLDAMIALHKPLIHWQQPPRPSAVR